ncbi:MAG: DUF1697 domain-containing protein [Patescibacteria group bacterium]
MVYVALLRGINVGGNSKVEMSRLRAMFIELGCQDVLTYINSGNVIFRDHRSAQELVSLIESEIAKEFGFNVRIVIRDFDNISKLNSEIPLDWTNDTVRRTDVMFLWDKFDNADAVNMVAIKPEIETIRYIEGALVWNIGRENVRRGAAAKLIGSDIYKHMTIRNINTVRKLYELMKPLADQ